MGLLEQLGTTENADKGVRMVLEDVDGDPVMEGKKEVAFIVMGNDSKEYQKVLKQISADVLKEAMGKKKKKRDDDKVNKDAVARCVIKWENVIVDGKELECNYKNIMMLFDAAPIIYEQTRLFMGDRNNYFRRAK